MNKLLKNFSLFLSFFFLAACSSSSKRIGAYDNFADLKKIEPAENYKISSKKRKSEVLVLAPHGGWIEPGTSEIATSLAGSKWSLYLFEGKIKYGGNRKLHITSSNFDEPQAIKLTKGHELCLSIHGYASKDPDPNICFGGLNAELAQMIHKELKRTGLQNAETENSCGRFYGQSNRNIVNRCALEGVQMELSKSFRDQLLKNKKLQKKFNRSIHKVVESYLKEAHQ